LAVAFNLPKLERLDAKKQAVMAALAVAMPARVITGRKRHYTDHAAADLTAGVLTVISLGEGEYKQDIGLVAKEGTQHLLFIGHIKLAESATGDQVEQAEINFIEELKAALRTGVTGLHLTLQSIEQSAQLETPYGWFVAGGGAAPPAKGNR